MVRTGRHRCQTARCNRSTVSGEKYLSVALMAHNALAGGMLRELNLVGPNLRTDRLQNLHRITPL